MISEWNPWHGCRKYSEGCVNCYVFRRDSGIGKNASIVMRNASFHLPIQKNANRYRIPPGAQLYTCMTSDFFIEDADYWRPEAWEMIRVRQDVTFFIFTKRIVRVAECLPPDWGDGYENVVLYCTMENQRQADIRLPVFQSLPLRHRRIICEPLLSAIDFHGRLDQHIEQVAAGGESGDRARLCRYEWVLQIQSQCIAADISFRFVQTGAFFEMNGIQYRIPRSQQHTQAKRAGINYK